MRTHHLKRSVIVPRPIEELFAFFSDPANLALLTPDWLAFRLVARSTEAVEEGCTLDYALRVHGLPFRWRSRITHWQPPYRFVDVAERGPFPLWRHLHAFESVEGGTRVTDWVEYRTPVGGLVPRVLVQRDLERVFAHRTRELQRRFGREAAAVGESGAARAAEGFA